MKGHFQDCSIVFYVTYIGFYVTYIGFALDRQEDVRDGEIENSEHSLCILAALNLILWLTISGSFFSVRGKSAKKKRGVLACISITWKPVLISGIL